MRMRSLHNNKISHLKMPIQIALEIPKFSGAFDFDILEMK